MASQRLAIHTYFGNLKDPRRAPRHRLLDILAIASCAVSCGANDWPQVVTNDATRIAGTNSCLMTHLGSVVIAERGQGSCRGLLFNRPLAKWAGMTTPGKYRLPHSPCRSPALRKGDRAVCLARDCDVIVTSGTDAPISWPRCRAVGERGGSGIMVDEELARAIRRMGRSAEVPDSGTQVAVDTPRQEPRPRREA